MAYAAHVNPIFCSRFPEFCEFGPNGFGFFWVSCSSLLLLFGCCDLGKLVFRWGGVSVGGDFVEVRLKLAVIQVILSTLALLLTLLVGFLGAISASL